MRTYLLTAGVVVSILTSLTWNMLGMDEYNAYTFYSAGNALFIFLLSVFVWSNHRSKPISFIFLCFAFNNLLDEIIFDNTEFGINEAVFGALIILVTIIRYSYARQESKPDR